jgi:hypothetical protein
MNAVRAVRILLSAFGAFWMLFVLAEGFEDGLLGFVMHGAVVWPFFILAWSAGRAPRLTGAILLVCAVFFFFFFDLDKVFADPLGRGRIWVVLLFVGPLAGAGAALLQFAAAARRRA